MQDEERKESEKEEKERGTRLYSTFILFCFFVMQLLMESHTVREREREKEREREDEKKEEKA